MSAALVLGFAAGCLGALAAIEGAGVIAPRARARYSAAAHRLEGLAEALARPGREGRDPGASERRRLLAAAAAAGLALGAVLAGLPGALAGTIAAPLVLGRAMRERRERYRRAVARGAAGIAISLADALGGGHSVRSAVGEAARGMGGPPGRELRRAARELTLGAPTEDVLEALRGRCRSHEIDTIVAGVLLQRRAGGDLARLLRESARAFEDQTRLEGEVRSSTAQARFTGLVVVLLPVGGALLAELASPGFLAGLADGFLTAWLVGLAAAMQVVAAVAIRRIGRVRE